jgi:chromosome segregation ATPase
LQHEIQQLRQSNQSFLDRHHTEIEELQRRVSDFTQKIGQADGILQIQGETLKENAAQLLSMRAALSDGETRRALMGREVEVKEKRISELESEIVRLNTLVSTKSAPRRRKNKFD